MKNIKYKVDSGVKSTFVFFDDLEMVRNRWNKVQANAYLVGLIEILEVDGQKINPKNFFEIWNDGDKELRFKRSYDITNPIIEQGITYLDTFYKDSPEYIHVVGKYSQLVLETEDWDDVIRYRDEYERFKVNGGDYREFMGG